MAVGIGVAQVYLTHTAINSGTPVRVFCETVTIQGKSNMNKTPNANTDGPVQVQTLPPENLKFMLGNVKYTTTANSLAWTDALALYTDTYNGSNYATLNITTGNEAGDGIIVYSGLLGNTDIKVVIDSPALTLSASDSRAAYLPVSTNLTFWETA